MSMPIQLNYQDPDSNVGIRVVYTENNGMEYDHEHAKNYGLVPGKTYTISAITVYGFSTDVYLVETKDKETATGSEPCFNSVLFEEAPALV